MQSRWIKVAEAGALPICMGTSSAFAASVTQPGELVGIPAVRLRLTLALGGDRGVVAVARF